MLKKYLKSIIWIAKNEAKMTAENSADFERFETEFDAWVAAQPESDQKAVESTIRAVRMALKEFPKLKILQCQEKTRG